MKLYVVVRNDLSQSQKSVQAGHAIAEFLLHRQTKWDNGILVILGVDNKQELEKLTYKLDMKNIDWVEFKEPDIGNEITAIASDQKCNLFSRLNLV